MDDLNTRVRFRLREEKARKSLTDRDIADSLGWSQARVTQKLTGRTPITLQDLEALCLAIGLSPLETLRDRGLDFVAELTPTEFRMLERIRAATPEFRIALQTLIEARRSGVLGNHHHQTDASPHYSADSE